MQKIENEDVIPSETMLSQLATVLGDGKTDLLPEFVKLAKRQREQMARQKDVTQPSPSPTHHRIRRTIVHFTANVDARLAGDWKVLVEAWEESLREYIAGNKKKLKKAKSALAKSQAQADELCQKIKSAWCENFKESAGALLKGEEERSKTIGEWIERLKEWIAEDNRKLRG